MVSYFYPSNQAGRVSSRYMNIHSQRQGESLQRLSSGSRVHEPKYDPSALAIGTKIKSDRMALREALSNTDQASAMLQVASGGLSSVLDTLTTMRSLTVRVTNGSLSGTETNLVQEEFEQLRQNIDQIADTVKFGGRSLLNNKGDAAVVANYTNAYTQAAGAATPTPFEVTAGDPPEIVNGLTRGHLVHEFGSQVEIDVTRNESNRSVLDVTIKAGSHTLTATTHGMEAGDPMILKSDDGVTQIAFATNSTAADFAPLHTRAGLETNLQGLLSGARLDIGASIRLTGAAGAAIPAASTVTGLNRELSAGNIQGTIANASITTSNGDLTVSLDVDGELFRGQGLVAATNGVLVLTGVDRPGRSLALNLGTIDPNNLGQIATDLNGLEVSLGDGATAVGIDAANIPADTFTAGVSSDTHGFIDGVAKEVLVTRGQGAGVYDIRLTLDTGQVFEAKDQMPVNDGNLVLRDVNDSDNTIGFTYDAAVTGLDNPSNYQNAIMGMLGLDAGGQPVQFISETAYFNGFNGFSLGVNESIKGSGSATPGKYAFSYDSDNGYFKLSNGQASYEVKSTSSDFQIVTFGNGITVAVGEDVDNPFDPNRDIDQVVFNVEDSRDGNFKFRISADTDSVVEIQIGPTSTKDLGLEGVNLANINAARDASAQIESAMMLLHVNLASLGGQQKRMEVTNLNLQIQRDNMATAQSAFLDVDIGEELTSQNRFQILAETAASMFYRAQQVPSRLTELILR